MDRGHKIADTNRKSKSQVQNRTCKSRHTRNRHIYVCEVDTYIYEERSFLCPVVRNRSLKIAKIGQHDGIAAGFEITAAILEIMSKSHKQARYGTEKNVSQMCGTKMNAHLRLCTLVSARHLT